MQGLGKVLFYFMGKRVNTAKWDTKRGHWKINVQKDGERRSFYSSTPGRTGQREANAKADAWLESDLKSSTVRVKDVFDDYLETLKLTTSCSNWMQIQSIGKTWIKPNIGTKKIEKLTEQHLQDIINLAFSQGRSKKTLSNIRASLMGFIKYCRRRKLTILFPEGLAIPHGARLVGKEIMQPQDIIKLFTIETTIKAGKRVVDDYINAYRLQILTGMRPGELIGLQWDDIIEDSIFIKRAINFNGEITKGKNENAIRRIVLGKRALDVIASQREISGNQTHVFTIDSQRNYEKSLKRYCESNGIPHLTPYELRHTFVSVTKALPEGQIRPIVGHSKNMDTYGIYGHPVEGEAEQTASNINDIFEKIILKSDA